VDPDVTRVNTFARLVALSSLVWLASAAPARAQNWSFDARQIALGSPVGGQNPASNMIAEANGYRSIVLPFGLIQVIGDFNALNPSSDDFDLVRLVEDVASPIHYTFGRHSTNTGKDFVVDLRNAELNRDLAVYRGFEPANQPRAEGVAEQSWGGTIRLHQHQNGAFQGIFIGAGPYVAMRTDLAVDNQLIDILDQDSQRIIPNTQIRSGTSLLGQLAIAIVGGYRGRFALPEATSDRDGVYVAVNYDVLRGLRYEDLDMALRLDTDPLGLLTVNPQLPPPLVVARDHATSGTGRAIDAGVGTVFNRWEVGIGANGIANRIDWSHVVTTSYTLGNPLDGRAEFVQQNVQRPGKTRVTMPMGYVANVGYNADTWTAVGDVRWGLGGTSLHGGYEHRLKRVALRGGGVYGRQLWSPTGGVGVDLSRRAGLDVAVYGNAANVERKRQPAVAVSIRLKGFNDADGT
jgi:hypothetical protein